MTVEYSQGLADILATPNTKLDWAAKLQAALGNSRRLILSKDGNVFLNVASTGPLTVVAGDVTDFGTLSNATVQTAANVSTGDCVLRLEGNGHWMRGTLGPLGSDKDYKMNAAMTAGAGVAMAKGTGVKAPWKLNSGTGPFAPVAVAKKPKRVRLDNWSTGAAVLAGYINLDAQQPNFVYDDAECATSMGDVRIIFPSNKVIMGDMEFGAIVWGLNQTINSSVAEPVYEVLVEWKPTPANWPGYPAFALWSATVSNTFAVPFKATIEADDGSTLFVHQMRDGLPINDPSLNQGTISVAEKPIRPHLHCAGALPWRSHKPKLNSFAKKYMPGFIDEVLRPTMFRQKASTNPPFPLYTNRQQNDGAGQWFAMPMWAPRAVAADMYAIPIKDPYIYSIMGEFAPYGPVTSGSSYQSGLGYEPGSVSAHDQLCGPGGPRIDRAIMATPYAIHITKADYIRPNGEEPIADLVEHFSNAYYNLPNFFITDVMTGATIPLEEVFANQWTQGGGYYSSNDSYSEGGPAKAINAFAIPNGSGTTEGMPYGGNARLDKNNRMPFNGAAPDFYHNYWSPIWQTLLYNSPMATYANKHRLISSILLQAGAVSDTGNPSGWFLVRQHAWRWFHYVGAWKTSSSHSLGVPRSLIEGRIVNELVAIYDHIYVPTMVENNQGTYFRALRNLGVPTQSGPWNMSSQSLTFYLAHVFQMMKVTGLWDVLWNKSEKTQKALGFMIRCMDLYTVDWALDTGMQHEWYDQAIFTSDPNGSNPTVAANWLEYGTVLRPPTGQEDWMTDANGNKILDRDVTQHLRYQYVCMRRDYLSDIPNPRLAAAIAKYKGFYDQRTAINTARMADPTMDAFSRRASDWTYLYPPMGAIKPPIA